MTDWITGKVVKIQFWTSTLFSLIVHAPIKPFIAGQFTKLRLLINGEYVQRAYSYVNAPDNKDLEFYIVNIKNGIFSSHLSKLQPDNEILIAKEAAGFFVLEEIPDCDILWMLATGTALGPYISILEYGKGLERFKNIVLVHAVRYSTDFSYLTQMLKLQERYVGKLRVQTVVSREITSNSLTGRIPALIENNKLEMAVGLPINNEVSHVMLCGNPQMIHDTQQLLRKTRHMIKHLRHRPGHVTTEQYW